MPRYDTAVLNGTVVVPYVGALRCDVGVRAGRIAALVDSIAPADADVVVDARGELVLPGPSTPISTSGSIATSPPTREARRLPLSRAA